VNFQLNQCFEKHVHIGRPEKGASVVNLTAADVTDDIFPNDHYSNSAEN